VRKWPSISEALSAEPFQSYLKQLKRRYSSEKIEHMVQSLGIVMGQEREAYFSDVEYAAALLDTKVEAIADVLSQDPRTARQRKAKPDGTIPPEAPTLTNLLVVWAPFVAGLAALAALAIASGTMGH
jgi:hypothetical protein